METNIDEACLRLQAYMYRQMPRENVIVGKNRWKPELLVFIKEGYEQVKFRVPKTFNSIPLTITTIHPVELKS